MTASLGLWITFSVGVLALLAVDLGLAQRANRPVTRTEAAVWSTIWIGLALVFNAGIYYTSGRELALEFLAGYLIEKSLSVDNVFVFLLIFSYFSVPLAYQRRVLLWGILGALVMRGVFIAVGATLLHYFHWVIYVFGVFLIFTGAKMLRTGDEQTDPENNPVVRLVRRILPVTDGYEEQHFFVRRQGKLFATPLLVVLLSVESTDLIFAVDSIPAIFAVTDDVFIVYTSNVFAILGLRALYFLIADVLDLFVYLRYGLGVVLGFVGVKMLLVDTYPIPIGISLSVIAAVLTVAVAASLLFPPAAKPAADPARPKEAV